MDWLVDLLSFTVGRLIEVVADVANFCAGAVAGFVFALLVAYVERKWRRQEVRAAEKRARLEERFEQVRAYAVGLQEFVEAGVGVVRVQQARPTVDGEGGASERLRRGLEAEWDKVLAVEPRPGALVFVRDRDAQKWLLQLRLWAQQCRDRCLECLGSGELMGEEEASGMVEFASEKLAQILEWMQEVVDEVES